MTTRAPSGAVRGRGRRRDSAREPLEGEAAEAVGRPSPGRPRGVFVAESSRRRCIGRRFRRSGRRRPRGRRRDARSSASERRRRSALASAARPSASTRGPSRIAASTSVSLRRRPWCMTGEAAATLASARSGGEAREPVEAGAVLPVVAGGEQHVETAGEAARQPRGKADHARAPRGGRGARGAAAGWPVPRSSANGSTGWRSSSMPSHHSSRSAGRRSQLPFAARRRPSVRSRQRRPQRRGHGEAR